jgi:brefeldin A-inhibited guanine nucleotide-exchange protein
MARFLFENKERLDKTQTGEVLGKETDAAFVKDAEATSEKGGKGFFLRVLHHYVDLMNFDGLMFDDAIRLFLSGFRLPGEAQKVSLQHMHEFKRLQHLESPSLQRLFAVYLRLIESWKNSLKDIHGKTQMYSLTQTLHSF